VRERGRRSLPDKGEEGGWRCCRCRGASGDGAVPSSLQDLSKGRHHWMRQRERKRLEEERGARAHRGDWNRAATSAGKRSSDEQNRTARRHFGVIERGRLERASRGFYRRGRLGAGVRV
jgi:hypothetical protein